MQFHDEIEERLSAKRVATVVVHHKGHILMGKRADTGKWTLPGGHLETQESPHAGAIRELEEEAGHRASSLTPLESHTLPPSGDKPRLDIHTFSYEAKDRFTATSEHDPDSEVESWHWIDARGGLPSHITDNLQHNPNQALIDAGIMSA
jgi:8-oxo-dGTP pyrophosphatase MutT (NUDIX family)